MVLFETNEEIPLIPDMIDWFINDSPQHIPWLLEKGYIREVVEEETYETGQWIKLKASDSLWQIVRTDDTKAFIHSPSNDTRLGRPIEIKRPKEITKSELCQMLGGREFTLIDDPLITEQSDTAERRPELCVHNEGLRCQIRLKTGHGHCENTAYTDCPDYTPK